MTPQAASDAPRMLPIGDDYTLSIESRLAAGTVLDLTALGVSLAPMPGWDWNQGSFQMCWREGSDLVAGADFRRTGQAAAIG